ncbi:MAG: hypothetical protein KME42_05525 [Tildeniella nuda ZEHNDER 1965/U140]|nr:hypothetical protein [Tildeniella nuda ZEHNDER 1965/U140]
MSALFRRVVYGRTSFMHSRATLCFQLGQQLPALRSPITASISLGKGCL